MNSSKGPFSYYVRVKGWVGGIAEYLLFLTGVGEWSEMAQNTLTLISLINVELGINVEGVQKLPNC